MAGRKRSGGKHGGRHGGSRGGGREGWQEGRPDQPTARRGRERNGPYWIYGDHAVAAAWDNSERIINRLLYTEDADLPPTSVEDRPKPELVDRRGLEAVLPLDAVHQGIAVQVMPLANPDILDLLPDPDSHGPDSDGPDGVVLVLDQISDPRNVGAILRSAAAFNALGVIMQDRHAPPEGGALAKAASGALETVPLIRINNLARCLEQLAEMGFWRHGLAVGEGNALTETSLTGKVALVLGAEGTGLRPLTQKNCDTLVHLSMAPAMESLNVSATAAIALFLAYQANTGGAVTTN